MHPTNSSPPGDASPPAAAPTVLILFAHPALQRSRVNRHLIDAVRDLEGVTLHDLYELYPDFDVDVRHEQRQAAAHRLIVLQHPFYWYSVPPLLKQWLDLVLEHGWAYGRQGTALHGKRLLCALTTGGSEAAYQHEGYNRFTIRELLAPLEQTARLCGMEFLPPFVVHGTHGLTEEAARRHAADYRRLIVGLRDDRVDLDAARAQTRLNANLDAILPSG